MTSLIRVKRSLKISMGDRGDAMGLEKRVGITMHCSNLEHKGHESQTIINLLFEDTNDSTQTVEQCNKRGAVTFCEKTE